MSNRSPEPAETAEVRFTAANVAQLARIESHTQRHDEKLDDLADSIREIKLLMTAKFQEIEKTIDDARARIDQIERVHIRWIAGGATLGAVAAGLFGLLKFVLNRG